MAKPPHQPQPSIVALSGGVGGAKLALGLSRVLDADKLTIVANTADDFVHLGLPISPDIDTLMYTLSGLNNTELGWGLANESWQTMEMLRKYGAETWFQLGDKDIATHLLRHQMVGAGAPLSEVTDHLRQQLGIAQTLLPMTDDPVQTRVQTPDGELSFQHYFVRERCAPTVTGFRFEGIETAEPQQRFMQSLKVKDLGAVVICPSNPFVSVQPMLELKGVRTAIKASQAPIIAVSPIVAGAAIKGPTAKIMKELKMPTTALAVADFYRDLIDGFVIDPADENQSDDIRALGIEVKVVPTVMKNLQDRIQLAQHVLNFSAQLHPHN